MVRTPLLNNRESCLVLLLNLHSIGYTSSELIAAIMGGNLDALVRPQDALFRCKDSNGGIQLSEYCYLGCTNPPNGDTCATGN
jgi:hypothetical protein